MYSGCAPHSSINLKPALTNLDLTQLPLSGLCDKHSWSAWVESFILKFHMQDK